MSEWPTDSVIVKHLERQLAGERKQSIKVEAENARLRKALEFYADETSHKAYKREAGAFHSKATEDGGHIAREALK